FRQSLHRPTLGQQPNHSEGGMSELSHIPNFLNDPVPTLARQFDVLQVTLTNHTNQEQEFRLWGANQGIQGNSALLSFTAGNYPQAVRYNPFNERYYVVNQLGDSVSIVDSNGGLVSTILLDSDAIPGTVSPTSLEVNPLNGIV